MTFTYRLLAAVQTLLAATGLYRPASERLERLEAYLIRRFFRECDRAEYDLGGEGGGA